MSAALPVSTLSNDYVNRKDLTYDLNKCGYMLRLIVYPTRNIMDLHA